MRKIWLTLAVFGLVASLSGGLSSARGADGPAAPGPDDRVLGRADAPVTIIEYASFTCPHCAEFDRVTLPEVKKNWIDTGKAKLVYRDFPLDGVALKASVMTRCAPPDRFYSYVDTLFQSQDGWARSRDPEDALSHIAKLGGMSDDQFKSCMKDEKLSDSIADGAMKAQKEYGVNSTPTFFVNGTKVVGAVPYSDFEKALNAALAAAPAKG